MAVIAGFSTSLDGFIADPDGNVGPLFDWYQNGDVEVPLPGYGLIFHMTRGWGGRPPGNNPAFVVSHRPAPADFPPFPGGPPYTFVHDGAAAAIAMAQDAAWSTSCGSTSCRCSWARASATSPTWTRGPRSRVRSRSSRATG